MPKPKKNKTAGAITAAMLESLAEEKKSREQTGKTAANDATDPTPDQNGLVTTAAGDKVKPDRLKPNGHRKRNASCISDESVIAARRAEVATLKARGYSVREIEAMLTHEDEYNGKRWSRSIIQLDIQHLREQWREAAAEEIEMMQGEILAELREVKKSAWAFLDFPIILRAIKQECELLGLDKPIKIARTNSDGQDDPLRLQLGNLTDEQLEALAILGYFDGGPPVIDVSPNNPSRA